MLSSLSWIQQHILIELTEHSTRRYSELRPRDVEGNLFTYHLNGLIKENLIEKGENAYCLTRKGKQFVSTLSLNTGKQRKQPQILVAVVAKNDEGEYLWSRWHREPNVGMVSFPHGMMHFGEGVAHMAALELAEKAGLEADTTYVGEVYVRVVGGDEINKHMLVHLFSADNIRGGRQSELRPEASEPFWAPISRIAKNEFLSGFYEIAQLVDTRSDAPLFADIVVDE